MQPNLIYSLLYVGEIKALGVESFGLSLTTMEEVFLRVESSSEETIEAKDKRRQSILVARSSSRSIQRQKSPEAVSGFSADNRLSGISLWLQQFYAVYVKRFLNSKRDFPAVISQMLLPIVFTIFALLVLKVADFGGDDPPLKLSLRSLGQTKGYVADFSQKRDWRVLKVRTQLHRSLTSTEISMLSIEIFLLSIETSMLSIEISMFLIEISSRSLCSRSRLLSSRSRPLSSL